MIENRIPYVYLIGWSELSMWYIGSRTGKNCTPADLWVKYFTSSKYVKEFVEDHGDPDIIYIIDTFSSIKECKEMETDLLIFFDGENSINFLNRKNGNALWDGSNNAAAYCSISEKYLGRISCDDPRWKTGEIHGKLTSNEAKEKIGKANSMHAPAKCGLTGIKLGSINISDPRWKTGEIVGIRKGEHHKVKNTENYKKPKSEKHKKSMGLAQKGRIFTNTHKDAISKSTKGKANAYKNGVFIGKFPCNDEIFKECDVSKTKNK